MNKYYSFSEIIKNCYSLIYTKVIFPQCRLLRRPIYIRGRRSISGAKNLTTGYACRFDLDGKKKHYLLEKIVNLGIILIL